MRERELMKRLLFAKLVLLFAIMGFLAWWIVPAVFAAGPTGASPSDPLMVPTGWVTIAPNTTMWFYFDYAMSAVGSRSRGHPVAQVTLDANGIPGLAFSIYTPDQAQSWLRDPSTEPVGDGTPYRDTSNGNITHDLYWTGAFATSGRYLVAVTNSRAIALMFTLTVTGETVALYPVPPATPTPRLPVPLTVTPVPTGTIPGKVLFETQTGGEIWTVNGDGSNLTRVSYGIDPAWSPDGKQITFARWDNSNAGLFIANADGSNEQLVFGEQRVRWPRWSPDGKSIVFSRDRTVVDRTPIWKLGVIELATGKLTEPQCSQLCYVPSWSKDSATIIYTDPSVGIMRTNIFQGQATLIGPTGRWWDSAAGISRPVVNWPPIENSEVSSDGNRIVYSMQAHDRWEVNVMAADGSGVTGITSPDPIMSILFDVVDHNVAPTWSNDGQQILFLSDRNGKWEFYVMNADGTGITQVLKNVTDRIPLTFGYFNERMMDWTN